MTLNVRVTDDQFGKYHRKVAAIADRLGKSLVFDEVMSALQRIHDGQFGSTLSNDDSLVVDFDKSLAEMIVAGKYDWVNQNITQKKYPVVCKGIKKYRYKVFNFDRRMSSEAVVEAMKVEKFAPARHEHGLAYGAKFPEEQRKHPIVCLGSSARVGGKQNVLYLFGVSAKRNLNLSWWDDDWNDNWFFLGVREVSATE